MIIKSAEFVKSAVKPEQYPDTAYPEIAFAGRSNVGKSSLINALLNRKRLVKTSSTPGRTRLLNFFLVNQTFTFVDLPGSGYAKVPKSMQKSWKPMVDNYLAARLQLQSVVLLMDIRRTPRQEEKDLLSWLGHYQIPPVLILTKCDKLSKTKRIRQQTVIAQRLEIAKTQLILFSAKTRQGRDIVWEQLMVMINPEMDKYSGI